MINSYIDFDIKIKTKPIQLESRRYIGNKTKLTNWLFEIINRETENINIFTDIFAGTAAVANCALQKYNRVIINDLLYANNVIYNGFFADGKWNKDKLTDIIEHYNHLEINLLQENYFSENFGGKYYDNNTAKLIGHIRQDIENMRFELTEKEYNILLATLIYIFLNTQIN